MEIEFFSEAVEDWRNAADYESEQPSLGDQFSLAVERVIELTLVYPEMGAVVRRISPSLTVRRRLVQDFNFEVIYTVNANTLVIIAIFYVGRQPDYWYSRIRSPR